MTVTRMTILILVGLFILLFAGLFFTIYGPSQAKNNSDSVVLREAQNADSDTRSTERATDTASHTGQGGEMTDSAAPSKGTPILDFDTSREVRQSASISLPLSESTPTEDVKHTIAIDEIRRGCFRQDCIPSVDDPEFVSVAEADDILPGDAVGIALTYNGETRFYPFGMLVTREIVNDTIGGDPVLVTYCPLCGTGIVFERQVDGTTYEFGVSGMLWQSNLLMYNRANDLQERSLWSQVLGEGVVGNHAGEKLKIIPSNIVQFDAWKGENSDAAVLHTGSTGDPYGGEYYRVARNFDPDFDEGSSLLDPSAYVHGVEINRAFKAYSDTALPVGTTHDTFAGKELTITRSQSGEVTITDQGGEIVPKVSGFWFSWIAAHPETELWQ